MDSITQFKKTKATFYLDCTILSVQQLLSLNILCNQMRKRSLLYLSLCGHAHSLQTGLKVIIGKLSFYTVRRNRGLEEDAS